MSVLRKLAAVSGVSLRLIARDRTALFFVVILPFLIILVVGSVTGDDRPARVGVVVEGEGERSAALLAALRGTEALDIVETDSADSAARAVRRGRLAGALVIPAGLDARVAAGQSVQLELLAPVNRGSSPAVRAAVGAIVQQQAGRLAAALAVSGPPFAERLAASERAAAGLDGPALRVVQAGEGDGGDISRFSHTAPANLVLFVFITSLASGAAMIENRRLGILRRMLASPTSVTTVLMGSAAARLLIALAQAVLILLLGRFAFGVRWGDPLAATLLVLVFAVVSVGAGLVISTVFRTTEQASAVAPPLGIALGMLGGCMWPLGIVGPLMRTVGHVTPHAWAMDAWASLVEDGAGLAGIGRPLAVLAAYAAVLFGLGTYRLRAELVAGS